MVTAIIQIGNYWVITVAVWEKCLDPGKTLRLKTIGFVTGLDIGFEKKRRVKNDPKIFDLNNQRDGVTVKWIVENGESSVLG